MSFTFVRIPANDAEEIVELSADKSGGLENDKLVLFAKEYFGTPMADISALTIPTADNDYTACSLYASTATTDLPPNSRATALLVGCGYTASATIRGDVFCGRCRDDEPADVWERLDFGVADADPSADWCRQARMSAGRPKTAASLQALLQQTGSAGAAPATIVSDTTEPTESYGQNDLPVNESWGKWTQSSDEVEVQIPVDADISTKDCKVVLKRNQVVVKVQDKEQLSGSTFDPIDTDESTFTFQNDTNQRWLVLHLAKANLSSTWTYAVR